MKINRRPLPSRRDAVTALLAASGATLVACAEQVATARSADAGTGAGEAGRDDTIADAPIAWATGGTKSMTARASYPNPFTHPATACVLANGATEGPCIEAEDRVRVDISEGYTGLPMRLALRVVDRSCTPVAGARVKVWHTHIAGGYSGATPNNALCLIDAADATQHSFRGVQISDAKGVVAFDSCFPGWYRGRAVHIHFTVSIGARSYSSQLVFNQTLVTEVFTVHPEYRPFGLPDTSNASDGIVRNDVASFTLTTERMADGALLASKDLVLP